MAGIEDLATNEFKYWRTEPFLETFQEFSPDKKNLGWKYPLQGRWFSKEPYYHWLGPDTIMKELNTKIPFNYYDEAGKIKIPGQGFTMEGTKSLSDLLKDQKMLSEWLPHSSSDVSYVNEYDKNIPRIKEKLAKGWTPKKILEDMTSYTSPEQRKEYASWVKNFLKKEMGTVEKLPGRYVDNPVEEYPKLLKMLKKQDEFRIPMTDFEKRVRGNWMNLGTHNPASVITPSQNIANQAKINLWESFKQNFMKYRHDPDLAKKNIYSPKTRWENISRIPIKAKDIYKRVKMGEKVKSGIPWSTIGQRVINNPFTRTAGWLGNVALGGQALSDVYAGTNTIGNMATNINKWAGVPFKDDGTVSHQLNLNSSPIKPKYNMPPKGAAGFNRGGIVSLVI
jgi:inhibitor of KinA sporulation pathway (predicted exonuclease)